MEYHPVTVKQHARPGVKHNPESRYWRRFKYPVFIKEYAPVTSVQFSPAKPHRYAVTAATRVQIYSPKIQKITKTISRFKDVARSANIRADGKLVVAGDDSGLIQVFDINSRAILRTLNAHKQPVHITRFSPLLPTQILSCSDDTTVRLWDMPSETTISNFTNHTDYVRTGVIAHSNPSLILTGSYDSTVRLFDTRSGHCEMVMGESLTPVPVEQVIMFPSGSVALSSAGPILRVWDLVAGGRCLRALSNHQKTVTTLAFDADSQRLLTGGLDQMVKVYDVSTYKVVHTMRYPAPLLCLAVSPDNTHIAAGMSDGTFSIRRREPKPSEAQAGLSQKDALRQGTYEFFIGAPGLTEIGEGKTKKQKAAVRATASGTLGGVGEFRVETRRKKRLKEYDRLLKAFKYSAALDSVLRKQVPPTTTFSLIQELVHRDGIRAALAGRDDVLLEPVLRLLVKHVSDPRFGELTCDVANLVIEMYAPVIGQSPLIDALFVQLRKKVAAELKFQKELVQLKGALDMVFASAALGA